MSRLLRFAIVGAACALLNLGALYIGTGVLGLDYMVSVAIAFVAINFVGFLLNKHFTFRNRSAAVATQALRYYLVLGLNLAVNLALMAVLVELLGVNYIVASVVVTVLFAGLNFLGHLRVTFESRRP